MKIKNQLILILIILLLLSLEKNHKKKVLFHYKRLLEQHGYDPKSVGWGKRKGKQSVRFQILSEIGDG